MILIKILFHDYSSEQCMFNIKNCPFLLFFINKIPFLFRNYIDFYAVQNYLLRFFFPDPVHNVATVSASAWVTEGVSRSRNALINGDTENYDWDSGYTCHQLGSGAIVVQLAQPFILDSMRYIFFSFTIINLIMLSTFNISEFLLYAEL